MSFLSRAVTGAPEKRTLDSAPWLGSPYDNTMVQGWATMPGEHVREGDSMSLGAFYACVTLLCDIIASLPLQAYRKRDGVDVLADPQPTLFKSSPYPEVTWFDWLWMFMESLAITGNGLGYIASYDDLGNATSIMPVHPNFVAITISEWRGTHWPKPLYTILGEEIPNDRIVHIKRYPLAGFAWGMSPVQKAAPAIDLGLAAQRYGLRYFQDAANPSSVLSTDQDLTPLQAAQNQKRWLQSHQGRRLPAVLSGGLKWQPVTLTPAEGQFISTREHQVSEIARIFRIPPHMIGETAKSTSWGCLPGDSLVFTTSGPVPIERVKRGDEVWSYDGNGMTTGKVTGWQMTGHKPLITVRTNGRELRLTANHRVPVRRYFGVDDGRVRMRKGAKLTEQDVQLIRSSDLSGTELAKMLNVSATTVRLIRRGKKWTHVGDDSALPCRWETIEVRADEIKPGDYLLVPNGMADSDRDMAPNGRNLTVPAMELCGLYTGDGSQDGNRFEIAHEVDPVHMDYYCKSIEDEFGVVPYVDKRGIRTRFSSVDARSLFESGFTGTALTKRVPSWVFRLRPELQLGYLRGYLDADGSINEDGTFSYASAHKSLLEDVRHLCIQLGAPVGTVRKGRDAGPMTICGRTCQSQAKYVLNLSSVAHNALIGSNSPRKAARVQAERGSRAMRYDAGWRGGLGNTERHYSERLTPGGEWGVDNVVLHRVVSVEQGVLEVPVYDIEVDGPSHFVADGVIVHNSGLAEQTEGFEKFTLRPWLSTIEQAISKLLPRGQFAKFDVSELLRLDELARWEAYRLGRDSGVYSVNDILTMEDRPKIGPEGDIHLQPANFIELGSPPPTAPQNSQPSEPFTPKSNKKPAAKPAGDEE